jgi:hypothetical protein
MVANCAIFFARKFSLLAHNPLFNLKLLNLSATFVHGGGSLPTKRGLRTRAQLYPAIFLHEMIIFNLLSHSKARKLTRAEYVIFITRNVYPVEMNCCSDNCRITALFNLDLTFSSFDLFLLKKKIVTLDNLSVAE